MRQATEKQQKRQQRTLEWQVKYRWPMTILFSLDLFISLFEVIEKRSQWPLLFKHLPLFGTAIPHSVWWNIFGVFVWTLVLVQWWMRVCNYRRDLLASKQLALQKAPKPAEDVWPPPPIP